ncbi:hypothetical protein [Sandarakinorhabdus sp. DWP1-3-1]|uniref:hypothetical protein n=1 Tax=Sandarakinorhabdus sp. DWP1-3-1 TaxID=2804627 RepID=UPI003CF84A11
MAQPFLPVPVQNRADGWTPEKQWKFVEALAQSASLTQAARAVRMSVRSAHRLRQHPQAAAFRAAWDAALGQAWGLLEQVALDRAVNGERETIERDGFLVAERRKPCSDRLLIHLLAAHERTQAAARADRAAAHKLALAEAKLAAIQAGADAPARRRKGAAPPPPPPRLPDDAAAATAALQAFHGHAEAFEYWPELDEAMIEHNALTARNSLPTGWRGPGDAPADVADDDSEAEDEAPAAKGGGREPDPATVAYNFANRPRWEDYAAAERAAANGAQSESR